MTDDKELIKRLRVAMSQYLRGMLSSDDIENDLLEAAARLEALTAPTPRRQFPVLDSGGARIDWQLVADHGKQAQANHYQTVERLAQRGGLSWHELHAVLHDKKFERMDTQEAIDACRAMEARYLAAITQPTIDRGDLVEALKLAKRMIDEALPKFNWGASALDANAITILNEAQIAINAALTKEGK